MLYNFIKIIFYIILMKNMIFHKNVLNTDKTDKGKVYKNYKLVKLILIFKIFSKSDI